MIEDESINDERVVSVNIVRYRCIACGWIARGEENLHIGASCPVCRIGSALYMMPPGSSPKIKDISECMSKDYAVSESVTAEFIAPMREIELKLEYLRTLKDLKNATRTSIDLKEVYDRISKVCDSIEGELIEQDVEW